jgi:hypothetical protein
MSSPPKTQIMSRSPTPRIYNKTALTAGACCVACSGCIAGSIGCLVGTAACSNCIKGTFCPKKTPPPNQSVKPTPIKTIGYNPRKFHPNTNKQIYDFDDVIIYVLPRLNFTIGDNRIGEYITKKFNLPTNVEYAEYKKLTDFLDPQIARINSEREATKIKNKTIGGTKRNRNKGKKRRRTNKR